MQDDASIAEVPPTTNGSAAIAAAFGCLMGSLEVEDGISYCVSSSCWCYEIAKTKFKILLLKSEISNNDKF